MTFKCFFKIFRSTYFLGFWPLSFHTTSNSNQVSLMRAKLLPTDLGVLWAGTSNSAHLQKSTCYLSPLPQTYWLPRCPYLKGQYHHPVIATFVLPCPLLSQPVSPTTPSFSKARFNSQHPYNSRVKDPVLLPVFIRALVPSPLDRCLSISLVFWVCF